MNKNILIGCLLSALIGSATTLIVNSFTIRPKLVYVDSAKLLNSSKAMQAARSVYQQKATAWQANIDTLAKEVERHLMSYEKESAGMSEREKKLSRELIKSKQNSLVEYQKAVSAQAREEDQKMTNEVLTRINTYLKKYGEEHGYQVILAATDYGNVAYADEDLDVTEEVLGGINRQ